MPASRAGPLAAGALAAGPRARVLGSHSRAAFVGLPDGARLAVLPAGSPLHPWAVILAPGVPLPAADTDVTIRLAGAERPELRLIARPGRIEPRAVAALETRLAAGAERLHDPGDEALEAALGAFRAGGGPAVLAGVIGLGPGLTPSGDDMVLGALAALDLARDAAPAARGLHTALGGAVRLASRPGAPARTTAFSTQLLLAAVEGYHAEPVLGVLDALALAPVDPLALAAAATILLATGGRSGRDLLRGLVATLRRLGAG